MDSKQRLGEPSRITKAQLKQAEREELEQNRNWENSIGISRPFSSSSSSGRSSVSTTLKILKVTEMDDRQESKQEVIQQFMPLKVKEGPSRVKTL